jgi:hypothetical protein
MAFRRKVHRRIRVPMPLLLWWALKEVLRPGSPQPIPSPAGD